jgi:hypothetical protein
MMTRILYYDAMNETWRYQRRFLIWMGVYSVVIVAVASYLPEPRTPDALHLTLALVPLIPLVFAAIENVRSIRAGDELYRRIHAEGMLFAVYGTIPVVLTVGFLQWLAGVPTFSVGWLFPVIMALYGVGVFIGRRRYA